MYRAGSQKFKLAYDPAVLLGMYPEEFKADTYTTMFIAALATIAKKWRQIKCPLRDEWRNKM
jgi:hypothetical protein